MDHLSGGTLANKLEASGNGLEEEEVRKLFRQLISAIHYCHEVKNVSHRDIKPENIMFDDCGKLHLCDFGMSQFFQDHQDLIRSTFGSIKFIAPEMLEVKKENELQGRCIDMWAAGITLFNLLTNEYPFDGTTFPEMREQLI